MGYWLTEQEYRTLSYALERLIPADEQTPGAIQAGVADYVDMLLGAFCFDPPRIWAKGPTSGRYGGQPAFGEFHELSALDELAWRIRIEGSKGIPEREFNGAVTGLQESYRQGLAALGDDFCEIDAQAQDERLRAHPEFTALLYEHACEGMYGAPEYGGNKDLIGWRSIGFAGDVQPRGWSDNEVTSR
ncbi:MAG: gluconate 2-dehydrogenase subunit 3 family protein [Actinobacteria bacterium]|nr:gluconate 2-dehydrogenase subunit 3 family protein [Actinomycetota bacterium]